MNTLDKAKATAFRDGHILISMESGVEVRFPGRAARSLRNGAFPSPRSNLRLAMCCWFNVHLKSNRGGEKDLRANIAMREESARQLLDHAAAMEKTYAALGKVSVIIGGDLNTSPDDPKFSREQTLKEIEKAGFQSCWLGKPLAQRVTLPSSRRKNPTLPPFPDACFDHAYVKGAKVVSSSLFISATNPSDHRPVVVEVELPAATG